MGTGASCKLMPCDDWLGPTVCTKGDGFLNYRCLCKPGYCAINGVCQRTNRNTSVGFLNPALYKHPEAFLDITRGDNRCARRGRPCCGGYDAGDGWDPVTGLGVI